MAVRVIAILIAVVNLYLLLSGKYTKDDTPKTLQKDSITTVSQLPIEKPIQNKSDSNLIDVRTKYTNLSKSKGKDSKESGRIRIQELLQYKGKNIEDAYFKVNNCDDCTSSTTGKDGIARVAIPKKIIESDKEYDFYVYRGDTLLYHKSMRFSDLQFNTYR